MGQEKARLEIHKGADGELDLGGLRFVACRREIEGIDGGVTLNVRGVVEGEDRDLVRFDFFRKRPHYHVPAENPSERAIGAGGFEEGLDWGLAEISSRMKAIVEEAGHAKVAADIDVAALTVAAPALRSLIADLAPPTEISYFEVDAEVLAGLRSD